MDTIVGVSVAVPAAMVGLDAAAGVVSAGVGWLAGAEIA